MNGLRQLDKPVLSDGLNFSIDEFNAMQRAILNLFSKWQLSDEQAEIILGGLSSKTIRRWRLGEYGRLKIDLAERLSNILGIHSALRILFKDAARGYNWISSPNDAFGGKSALDIMLGGRITDIIAIRRYLDAERGGW